MDCFPFPRLRFVDENGLVIQLDKIKSELKELVAAFESEPIERVSEEAADVAISAITFLRIIHRQFGIHPLDVLLRKHEYNKLRGYEVDDGRG